jgi:hypothetical protein
MKDGKRWQLRPIGKIRLILKRRGEAPKQGSEGAPDAWLEVSGVGVVLSVGRSPLSRATLHKLSPSQTGLSYSPALAANVSTTEMFCNRLSAKP